ncbi:MAG: amidohydrolase family protein [Methylobacteriaceae bacterium]|jgi:dihydroorotase|nr:amidohydrolase family protein [Methylobacteriaceae bacterium]
METGQIVCDVLIKNARIIDPSSGVDAVMDIAVTGDVITSVAADIDASAEDIFDASGRIAVPGIIDLHAHAYPEVHGGLEPDIIGVLSGVTTVFDGGSAGAVTFPYYLQHHLSKSKTDTYAFLHVNPAGQLTLPEIWDKSRITVNPQAAVETIKNNSRYIKGLKTRVIGPLIEHWGLEAVDMALDICNRCDVPFMVHIGLDPVDTTPDKDVEAFTLYLLERLRPGDIIAHAFTGKRGKLFREDGLFDDVVAKAVERGVVLDASVGRTNFLWESLRLARTRGFAPQVLSTDLTVFGMKDALNIMGLTLSKMVAFGYTLKEVLEWVTAAPARVMNMPDKGKLTPGLCADISILDLVPGDYGFFDKFGGTSIRGDLFVAPYGAFRKGKFIKAEVTGLPAH